MGSFSLSWEWEVTVCPVFLKGLKGFWSRCLGSRHHRLHMLLVVSIFWNPVGWLPLLPVPLLTETTVPLRVKRKSKCMNYTPGQTLKALP